VPEHLSRREISARKYAHLLTTADEKTGNRRKTSEEGNKRKISTSFSSQKRAKS
jgi:hypothetical protein